jgi:hypothetical protein
MLDSVELAIDGAEPTSDDSGEQRDALTGVRLLRLMAEAADPRGPRWVHRRVHKLEFLDTRAVRWRMSVDFDVPADAPVVEGSEPRRWLVPVATWGKGDLVAFDFRDEQDVSVPLMTSQWTSGLMARGLSGWAGVLFPHGRPGWVPRDLSRTVYEVGELGEAAMEAQLDGDQSAFRHQLAELADNFVVLVAVASPPGTRRIVKLSFESAVTFRRPQGVLRRLGMSLGLLYWRLEVPFGGRGGSHHLEVTAPNGVDIYKITARLEPAPSGRRRSTGALSIPAADGRHYGDDNEWTPQNQRDLVDALRRAERLLGKAQRT